jgi:hypothetical protein
METDIKDKKGELKNDDVFLELKALADMFPDDGFLQHKVKYYLPYKNLSGKTDNEIWQEGLITKYGK